MKIFLDCACRTRLASARGDMNMRMNTILPDNLIVQLSTALLRDSICLMSHRWLIYWMNDLKV